MIASPEQSALMSQKGLAVERIALDIKRCSDDLDTAIADWREQEDNYLRWISAQCEFAFGRPEPLASCIEDAAELAAQKILASPQDEI